MRLTDTHSHLYAPEFDADREEALARAADAGVERVLLPAIDSESHERLFGLCRSHPERCVPMMGLHPTSVNDNPHWHEELALVERYLETPPAGIRFCAVGEIGLDLYWSRDFRAEQLEAFRRQIDLSLEYGLPIAVHTRDAWPETVELMREYKGRGVRGVFHAFSDTADTYRELKEYGDFVFGIGGVVTFKKSKLAEAVREMQLRDIVLETVELMREYKGRGVRGVFHAFSDTADTYRELKEYGDFVFGIGGVVTFKKSKLAEAVREMQLRDIVLETDCPYLTPAPHRGERNESAYVRYVCEKVAELKGLTPGETAEATTANAERIFGK